MAAQEQFCDVAETMAVPEDVQRVRDDQSDGVKYYLSTLAPLSLSLYIYMICMLNIPRIHVKNYHFRFTDLVEQISE